MLIAPRIIESYLRFNWTFFPIKKVIGTRILDQRSNYLSEDNHRARWLSWINIYYLHSLMRFKTRNNRTDFKCGKKLTWFLHKFHLFSSTSWIITSVSSTLFAFNILMNHFFLRASKNIGFLLISAYGKRGIISFRYSFMFSKHKLSEDQDENETETERGRARGRETKKAVAIEEPLNLSPPVSEQQLLFFRSKLPTAVHCRTKIKSTASLKWAVQTFISQKCPRLLGFLWAVYNLDIIY